MTTTETHSAMQVEVRGLPVAVRRAGAGEPILYLHGLGMTRRWLPVHEALSRLGDLVAPEHPGFGDTPMPEWLDALDDLVVHYADLLDQLALGPVHLVGYSFGGWIAAEVAAFYPERLSSLTLIAPFGLRVDGHTPTDVFRMSHERFLDLCFNGEVDPYAEQVDEGDEALLQSYAEMTAFARVGWNPRYDRKLDRRLGRVTAPTRVLAGADDRILPRAHPERYAELLGGTLVTVDGVGHGLVAQAPQRVADEVATVMSAV